MITLKTFDGQNINPIDDATLYDSVIGNSGILYGCELTHLGANQLRISSGRMIIKGRIITIMEEIIYVEMSSSGTVNGRLLIHMDLGNTEEPIRFISQAAALLPELIQNENCNYESGVYELVLATYKISETLISELEIQENRFPYNLHQSGKKIETVDTEVNKRIDELQTEIGEKQATITGAATTILSSNLSANKALVSDANGKVSRSSVTSTELGYLAGVTGKVQTQLNNKSNILTIQNLTAEVSVVLGGNGSASINASKSGYTCIGVIGYAMLNGYLVCNNLYYDANTKKIEVYVKSTEPNPSGTMQATKYTISVFGLYVKN